MKNKIIFLLSLCCIVLIGCGSKDEVTTNVNVSEESEEVSTIENTTIEESSEIETESLEPRENTTFRNTCWGDDIETVKKYEDAEPYDETDNLSEDLLYIGNILGYNTYIIYNFENNKLYKTMYGLNEEYTSSGQYIPQYDNLKNSLKKIYGEPIEDAIIPMENQSLIDTAGAASSLEFGYVAYRAKWETENTSIMIGMQAQNYKISMVIQYQDISYKEDINDSGL